MPDAMPMQAAAWRLARTRPCGSAATSMPARKIAGIIRYTAPLPTPLATNRRRKEAKNPAKLPAAREAMTPRAPRAMTA